MTTATEPIVLSPRLVALVVATIIVATGRVPSLGPIDADAALTRLLPAAALDVVGAEVRFEPNLGQAPDGIDYVAHGHGYSFDLGPAGARLSVGTATRADVEMHLLGASGATDVAATQRLSGVSNYLIGDDP